MEQFTHEKEIAKHIKVWGGMGWIFFLQSTNSINEMIRTMVQWYNEQTWMEEKYGPTWHCIVGSEYKTSFTYESKNFVRFNVGKKCITLFRHP
jgi:hypothetical protein